MHYTFATVESFGLNFEIFLTTFCWRLFEPANQNMGTVEGGDVKVAECTYVSFTFIL